MCWLKASYHHKMCRLKPKRRHQLQSPLWKKKWWISYKGFFKEIAANLHFLAQEILLKKKARCARPKI